MSDTLTRLQQLLTEITPLQRALENFNADGVITEMTVAMRGEPGARNVGGTTISTIDWPTPPQMIETIKGMLQQRISAIESELSQLGVGAAR